MLYDAWWWCVEGGNQLSKGSNNKFVLPCLTTYLSFCSKKSEVDFFRFNKVAVDAAPGEQSTAVD